MGPEAEARLAELGDRLRRVDGDRLSRLLTSSFPFTVGRLDWQKARSVIEHPAPLARANGANVSPDGFHTSAYVREVVSFFRDCTKRNNTADEWVAFVSESVTAEYEVKLSAVPDLLATVADVPDHKYVFGLDGSWCLMWSFEDDLYFGLRPSEDVATSNL